MKRLALTCILAIVCTCVFSQHIEYRHKITPAPVTKPEPKTDKYGNNLFGAGPHEECPALPASLPVLMNYIDPEVVKKMKRMYDDHVYSITKLLNPKSEVEYKLTICYKG